VFRNYIFTIFLLNS